MQVLAMHRKRLISGLDEARAADQLAINRKLIIISCSLTEILLYVEDYQTFDETVTTLRQIFIKQMNNVYPRH